MLLHVELKVSVLLRADFYIFIYFNLINHLESRAVGLTVVYVQICRLLLFGAISFRNLFIQVGAE